MNDELCLVGVDAGTSVVKAVAFDATGNEIYASELPMPLRHPEPLWIEQDMDELWQKVKDCLRGVRMHVKELKAEIVGIGITSTGDGTWIIDRAGNSVRGGILWCDGRAGKVVDRLHAEGIAHQAFDICGTSVFTGSTAPQLLWLRENEPEVLEKAQVIFHAKDWLFYKLTGLITSDETDESLTMLRMSTRQYDPELFRIFGIEELYPKFPPVKPTQENVGALLPEIAADLDLPNGLTIGSGPMDVAACALGTGAIEHGQASSILGTAGIHEVIMAEPMLKPRMVGMTLCHGVPGRWIRMMAAMTATPNLEWFLKELGTRFSLEAREAGTDLYEHVEKQVDSVPAGSEGVIFHPYLFPGGERGPFVKPSARASFSGLNLNHTGKHLLRAVYEGVAFATLDCYRHMPIDPKLVFLSGGGAKSPVWCQIVADCLGKPVKVPEGSQFGAKGAAINVGIAVEVYRNAQDGVAQSVRTARVYEPDSSHTKLYHQLYEVYQQTAERQMDLWDRRAEILDGVRSR
ncbi:MAG TPA: FGGY-family carbohydrate kinase [Terriglobia bacterium]|nr:FGGY-family carbohydrate kinase [Terriglobia bacterium]